MVNEHNPLTLERVSGLEGEIFEIKQQIEALGRQSSRARKVWYKDATTLIAALALVLSLITTVYSFGRSQRQDITDARSELKSYIERLSDVARELHNAGDRSNVYSRLSAEHAFLASQAASLAQSMSPDDITAPQFHVLAHALANSGYFSEAIVFLEKFVAIAQSPGDKISGCVSLGSMLIERGRLEEGEEYLNRAVGIVGEKLANDKMGLNIERAHIELAWADALSRNKKGCEKSGLHLDQAREFAARLPSPPPPGVPDIPSAVDWVTRTVEMNCTKE